MDKDIEFRLEKILEDSHRLAKVGMFLLGLGAGVLVGWWRWG